MGSKNNPGKFDCLAKAHPDEPYFTLLGRDPTASLIVLQWAELRERLGKTEPQVLDEARGCAATMVTWAERLGKKKQIDEARMECRASEICPECGSFGRVTSRLEQTKLAILDPTVEIEPYGIVDIDLTQTVHRCAGCSFEWTGADGEHERTEAMYLYFAKRAKELHALLKEKTG